MSLSGSTAGVLATGQGAPRAFGFKGQWGLPAEENNRKDQ